jgi:CHAT domain-containing protein/tetratricopeptide (TPR) repeat protein
MRAAALGARDLEGAAASMRFVGPGANWELALSGLVGEHLLRSGGSGAQADTLLRIVCSRLCTLVSDEPEALVAALDHEMRERPGRPFGRRGPTQEAVRALLGDAVRREVRSPEPSLQAMLLWDDAESEVTRAADSLVAAGRIGRAADLLHAYAYLQLPREQRALYGPGTDALKTARAALVLRKRSPRDPVAEGRTTSLVALAYLRRFHFDSAGAAQARAEELIRGADADLRALFRRRSAVIAAARGDHGAAEQLVAEAVALRGAGSARGAGDRHRVARELVGSGRVSAGAAAVRQARLAHLAMRNGHGAESAAHSALTMAEAHRLNRQADSAAHYFRLAADGFQAIALDEPAAQVLAALAELEFERGRLAAAEARLAEADSAAARWPWGRRHQWDPADGVRARILNDRGLIRLAQGRPNEARALFAEARAQAPTQVNSEFWETERNLGLLRIAAMVNGDSAATSLSGPLDFRLTAAWEIPEPVRQDYRPLRWGLAYALYGEISLARGDLAGAYPVLTRAIELLRQTDHRPSLGRAQRGLAKLFERLGRPDSAAVYYAASGDTSAALAARGSDAAPGGDFSRALRARVLAQPPADALRELRALLMRSRAQQDRFAEARALELLGFYYMRRHPRADFAAATAYQDSAATVLEEIMRGTAAFHEGFLVADTLAGRAIPRGLPDWFRVQLAEQSARLQEESALAWLARAPELGERASAAAAAAAADRGRGRAFGVLAATRDSLGVISGRFRSSFWEDPMPKVGEELFDHASGFYTSPEDGRGTTLSYLLARDTLLVWVRAANDTTASGLRVVRRPIVADSLAALVTRARAVLAGGQTATAASRSLTSLEDPRSRGFGFGSRLGGSLQAVRALTALLLPREVTEVLGPKGKLLVVASGVAAAVPFAALPFDSAGTPLSERFSVQYAPSLHSQHTRFSSNSVTKLPPHPEQQRGSALGTWDSDSPRFPPGPARDSVAAARRAWLARAVVLGNPLMPTVRREDGSVATLPSLPGAEAEARAVARRMGVEALTGAAATLDALRPRAAEATVVHLATHGFAYGSEAKVDDSFVALAPTAGEDGLLTVAELGAGDALRLPRAELVVLSACQTGLGQLTTSEGTLGLQRAFLAAGTRSVLVSLWSVSDEATALLLKSFYEQWLDNPESPSKAEALRRAQEQVRRTKGYEHPMYWAAFQLVQVQ